MNLDNLAKMERPQLLELAGKLGLQVHWKAKPETIIKQITQKAFEKPKTAPDMKHEAEKPSVAVHHNTPEQVEAAIKAIKARSVKDGVERFKSIYDKDENTWQFECLGAVESGNLDIPLRLIVQKATNVARGRLYVRALNKNDFGSIGGNPNSAYADVVIAG